MHFSKYHLDFITEEDRRDILLLAKMCFAKHEFGVKRPTPNELAKVVIPKYKAD